jgi:hypothetical protein
MIKASQINNLLEEWVSLNQQKFEVLENPTTWREAASSFKKELKELISLDSRLLRFIYKPKTKKLRVWIAYYATHGDLLPGRMLDDDDWYGWINILNKTAGVSNATKAYKEYILSIKQVPEELAKFLSGLKFENGWL